MHTLPLSALPSQAALATPQRLHRIPHPPPAPTPLLPRHGFSMRGVPYYDGAGFVAHCPINPERNFTYRFRVRPDSPAWGAGAGDRAAGRSRCVWPGCRGNPASAGCAAVGACWGSGGNSPQGLQSSTPVWAPADQHLCGPLPCCHAAQVHEQPGTYFLHGHSSVERADGLQGPLIVRPRRLVIRAEATAPPQLRGRMASSPSSSLTGTTQPPRHWPWASTGEQRPPGCRVSRVPSAVLTAWPRAWSGGCLAHRPRSTGTLRPASSVIQPQ